MVLGIFYFQKYKGHGDGDEQNVMISLGPDRPGQNAIFFQKQIKKRSISAPLK